MNRKKIKFLISVILMLVFQSKVALAISSNGGTLNNNMNNKFGTITDSTTIDGWHSSSGYWRFSFNDWNKEFIVKDADVPNYFSGTQKTFNQNLEINRTLPTEVQKFISVYGKDKLGVKFTVGKNGSILGNDIAYEISGTNIKLMFRPIMKYNRYNMWEYYNSSVWGSMTRKVHTAEVTDGYGENYVSVRGGSIGLRLLPNIMRNAYKASDGTLRFNTNDTTTLGDGTTVIARNEIGTSTFWGGGASGIYFRYPINIEFYDMNISANIGVSNTKHWDGSSYWVKSGEGFSINTKGIPSNVDSLVRPTQNTIRIDSGNTTQWIDMRKNATSNTVQQSESNSANHVRFVSVDSSTSSNGTFNANANVVMDGDKDISISSMSRLNNFQNGTWDTSKFYKESSYTGKVTVKSDSQQPIADKLEVSVNNDNYTLNVVARNVRDTRSGLNTDSVIVDIYSIDNPTQKISAKLNRNGTTNDYQAIINIQQGGINNVYGNMGIKLFAEDNVTNGRNKTVPLATGSFLKGRADLTIQTMQIVDSSNNPITNIVQNKDYRAKVVVANIDKLKSKSCNLQLKNITNNTIVGNVTVAEINPGATTTVYIPINSSSLGGYEVEGFIDSNNVVVESNENNNKAKVSYSIYQQNNKPIAQFDVNPKIEDRNRPLTYSDTSYDPDSWDSIVQREWQWTRIKDEKGNTVSESINTGSTPPKSFNVYGTYQIKLRVKDKGNIASPSLWSEWSTPKNVQIKNLISVSAEIIPGEARQGQLVKLKIKTTYSPNKLFIKFPNDIIEKSNTKIKIDLNGDGIIDEADVDLLEPHYNAKPGDSNWKGEYDLNKDGIIDIFDMTIVAQNMGKEISEFDKLNEIVTLDIVPQDQFLTTEYEFYLPTNTDLTIDKNGKRVKNKYRFEIRALREIDGQEANTFVELDVKGSIYDGIRTRMK